MELQQPAFPAASWQKGLAIECVHFTHYPPLPPSFCWNVEIAVAVLQHDGRRKTHKRRLHFQLSTAKRFIIGPTPPDRQSLLSGPLRWIRMRVKRMWKLLSGWAATTTTTTTAGERCADAFKLLLRWLAFCVRSNPCVFFVRRSYAKNSLQLLLMHWNW